MTPGSEVHFEEVDGKDVLTDDEGKPLSVGKWKMLSSINGDFDIPAAVDATPWKNIVGYINGNFAIVHFTIGTGVGWDGALPLPEELAPHASYNHNDGWVACPVINGPDDVVGVYPFAGDPGALYFDANDDVPSGAILTGVVPYLLAN